MDTITKTDTACEKFSSARYAQRMGTSSPCESQAAVDQAIQVRSFNDGVSQRPDGIWSLIIGNQQQEIWSSLLGSLDG
jgi:hypothetical protein